MALEQLLEVARGALGGRLLALSFGSSYERGPVPLLVPPFITRVVEGAFTSTLVPLGLASRMVDDHPDHHLA
jgi:hypothetical protein